MHTPVIELLKSALRALACALLLAASGPANAQTWTRLTNDAPDRINLMLLLSDGTVMGAVDYDPFDPVIVGKTWYRLTPDIQGSYVNGTWSSIADMHDTRLYFSSQVLRDGRVFVGGGEYGTGGAKAEVYDPLTDIWTSTPTPPSGSFADSPSELLPDGRVLVAPVLPSVAGQTIIYDPTNNTWSTGPRLFRGNNQSEASWVKLADRSILTIDPYGTFSERYIPATNTWINDAVVPTALYNSIDHELGAGVLLANGNAFFLGASGRTAIYTPSGTTAPGAWIAGPDIPGGKATPDAPAAVLVTGHVLCAVSPKSTSSSNSYLKPTTFYEYDPVANSFTFVNAPTGASDDLRVYQACMLDLPDGSVLYSHMDKDLYTYRPNGAPLAAGKPVVTSITQNDDGSYHLVGTGLNGISEGAYYGDDFQMNTNYPLVRLTDDAGNVRYARTSNWSSTGVMTGTEAVSTEYRLPAGLPPGRYSLAVVANGISSDPSCAFAPSVGANPTPSVVCASGAATLSASTTDLVQPTFRWQYSSAAGTPSWTDLNDGPISIGGNPVFSASGATTPTLTVTPGATGWPPSPSGPRFLFRATLASACGTTSTGAASLTVCAADFNCSGAVTVQDIFDFLAAWFARLAPADFNQSGVITVQDIFDFLTVWFGRCA